MTDSPELIVLNLNKNYTGVSSTTSGVVAVQKENYDMRLLGYPLDSYPEPISKNLGYQLCKAPPKKKTFSIWHVRRNPEMRVALWARDILKLPIKIVFTSAAQRYHSTYPRWLISKMDAIIATTPEAAKYVSNVYSIVPHGVDTKKFHIASDRTKSWEELGYGGKLGVATIGRIRPEKGTDIFVDTMLKVLPKHPNLTALIIGKATKKHQKFKKQLQEKIDNAGYSDRILFVGEITPEKMPLIIRSLSLLIALPRYEGYGMTPLEALSSGVPFVSSDTGYFKEFSNHNMLGKIVPIGDSDQAARCINDWLNNTDKLKKASKDAIDFIKKNHDISKEAAEISKVYESLWENK